MTTLVQFWNMGAWYGILITVLIKILWIGLKKGELGQCQYLYKCSSNKHLKLAKNIKLNFLENALVAHCVHYKAIPRRAVTNITAV